MQRRNAGSECVTMVGWQTKGYCVARLSSCCSFVSRCLFVSSTKAAEMSMFQFMDKAVFTYAAQAQEVVD